MKTLTTLTAAVALIAGISIAQAADSSSKVTGTGKYCVKGASGELNCNYASLSACQGDAKGADCVANPNIGTTGTK